MFWDSLLSGISGQQSGTTFKPIETPGKDKDATDSYLAFGLIALLLILVSVGIYKLAK